MLAQEIATSEDGLTYSFTLRDGRDIPRRAVDIERGRLDLARFLDPKGGWPCRANFDGTAPDQDRRC